MRFAFALLIAVVAWPPSASAQVLQRPQRSPAVPRSSDVEPNVTRQELSLVLSFLSGYDDNVAPEGTGVAPSPYVPAQTSYTGVAAAELSFWRGRTTRSLEVTGGAYMNSYRGLQIPTRIGGDLSVRGVSKFGRRTQLSGRVAGHSRPTFTMSAFAPIAQVIEPGAVPDTDPTSGVAESRWLSGTAAGELIEDWNRSHHTTAQYDLSMRSFETGVAADTYAHMGAVTHSWSVSRNASLLFSYRYSHEQTRQELLANMSLRSHTAESGVDWHRRLSRSRAISFGGTAGATFVRATSAFDYEQFEYTGPSGAMRARVDLGRTWSVAADYTRAPVVLDGVTPQSMMTDAASVRVAGNITRRLQLATSASYSHANAPTAEAGSYEEAMGMTQVQFALYRWCSVVGNYAYYEHRSRNLSGLPRGFPSRLERNIVRIGVTVVLPPSRGATIAGGRRFTGGD